MDNKKNRLRLKSKVSTTEEKSNVDNEVHPRACNNIDRNQSPELKDCTREDDLASVIKSVKKTNMSPSCSGLEEVLKSLARRRKRVPLESITDLPEFQRNTHVRKIARAADNLPSLPKMQCSCLLRRKHQAWCVPSASHLDEKMRSTDSTLHPVQLNLSSVLHTTEAKKKFPGNTSNTKSEITVLHKTENLKEPKKESGKLGSVSVTSTLSQQSLLCPSSLHSMLAQESPNCLTRVDAKRPSAGVDMFLCTGDASKSGTSSLEELAGPIHPTVYPEAVLSRTKVQEISPQLLFAQLKDSTIGRSRSKKKSSESSCRVESGLTAAQDRRLDSDPLSPASDDQAYRSKITYSESDTNKSRSGQTLKVDPLNNEGTSEKLELLTSCPLCLAKFSKGLNQVEIDGHIAACLSASADDIVW